MTPTLLLNFLGWKKRNEKKQEEKMRERIQRQMSQMQTETEVRIARAAYLASLPPDPGIPSPERCDEMYDEVFGKESN
jgi:hypothetical protein